MRVHDENPRAKMTAWDKEVAALLREKARERYRPEAVTRKVRLALPLAQEMAKHMSGDRPVADVADWAWAIYEAYSPGDAAYARDVGYQAGEDIVTGERIIRSYARAKGVESAAIDLDPHDVGRDMRVRGFVGRDPTAVLDAVYDAAHRVGRRALDRQNWSQVFAAYADRVGARERSHEAQEAAEQRRIEARRAEEAQAAEAAREADRERDFRSQTYEWRELSHDERDQAQRRARRLEHGDAGPEREAPDHFLEAGGARGAALETDAEVARKLARLLSLAGMASAAREVKAGRFPSRAALMALAEEAKGRTKNARIQSDIAQLAEALYPSEAAREAEAARRGASALEHDDPIEEFLAAAEEIAAEKSEIARRASLIELNPPKSAGTWFVLEYDRAGDRHRIVAWESDPEDAEDAADEISGAAVAEADIRDVIDPDDASNWADSKVLKKKGSSGVADFRAWTKWRKTAVGSNPPKVDLPPEDADREKEMRRRIAAIERQKNKIYSDEYRPISEEVWAKYRDDRDKSTEEIQAEVRRREAPVKARMEALDAERARLQEALPSKFAREARSAEGKAAREAEKAAGRRYGEGECQVCEHRQAVDKVGRIVLHGYQRPGIGFILGRCLGESRMPFPATDALEEYVESLRRMRAQAEKALADLPAMVSITLPVKSRGAWVGSRTIEKATATSWDWRAAVRQAESVARSKVKFCDEDIPRAERRIAEGKRRRGVA